MLNLRDFMLAQMEKEYNNTDAKIVVKYSLLIPLNYLLSLLTITAQNAVAAIQLNTQVLKVETAIRLNLVDAKIVVKHLHWVKEKG
jgi:hypothetical protein